jgi:micrococcal nuclease
LKNIHIKGWASLIILFLVASCSTKNVRLRDRVDGRVVSITDGDTFTLLTEEKMQVKIRLHGIDCPEKKQDFGNVAKLKLSELIFGKQVYTTKTGIDRYGRTVALVYDAQNRCINEEMLKVGLAWHYIKYDQNPSWDTLEAAARKSGIGLWELANPTPPWQWRRK